MVIKNYIMKESYYDSVLLMRLAGEAGKLPGVSNISVGMGTPLNKDTIQELGLLLPEGEKATPNDLIIALSAETDETAEKIRALRRLEAEALDERVAVLPVQAGDLGGGVFCLAAADAFRF